MYNRTKIEMGVRLAIVIAAAAAFAACDRSATAPDRNVPARALGAAHHDDIKGDTTSCLNGWVIIAGVYVCN